MNQLKQSKKQNFSIYSRFNNRSIKYILSSKQFAKVYFWLALLILFASTIFWAFLGAKLHLSNSDQLANSLMFTSIQSIHDSLLPQAHSFLLKWPLFLLSGMLGAKSTTITALTILMALVTVASLAYILYRIDKRPLVIGTIYIAIASMLLLVPVVPYAGALLPVSMAMLTTRNIEYIIFILALILVIRSKIGHQKLRLSLSILLLTLLFASDKLFVSLSFGGALVLIVLYGIAQNWRIVRFGSYWITVSWFASIFAIATLWLINATGIAHIVSQGSGLGPYGFISTLKEFILGSFYAITGLLTNFGANPAYSAVELKQIPNTLQENLLSPALFGYVINLAFLCIGLIMTILLIRASVIYKAPKNKPLLTAPLLSVMLIAASVTSVVSFIITKHEYPVDARYLAIAFFAVTISATTFAKSINIKPVKLITIGLVTSIAIIGSLIAVSYDHKSNSAPLEQYTQRNNKIANVLASNDAKYIVGDYWRVLPIAFAGNHKAISSPLADCNQYRASLTRTDWQPELTNDNFAYLLTLDKGLTDFPACTEADVIKHFGQPSSSTLIAGTLEQPIELLLYYDRGKTNKSDNTQPDNQQITLLPRPLEQYRLPKCSGQTIMTIVAHQDDDLLFMNPDLQHSINSDSCLRTVYITAGDGGMGDYYWLGREKGSIAAYSQMANIPADSWQQKTVKIGTNAYAVIATPKNYRDISLIFLRLPDGGLQAEGFPDNNFANLAKLHSGSITSIQSVDKQSSYTNDELKQSLVKLVSYYKPTEIRSQMSYQSADFPDHADHMAVADYVSDARNMYISQLSIEPSTIALKQYHGYPVRESTENVAGEDLTKKMSAFLAYSQKDEAVCHSAIECAQTPTYGGYLGRQYYN